MSHGRTRLYAVLLSLAVGVGVIVFATLDPDWLWRKQVWDEEGTCHTFHRWTGKLDGPILVFWDVDRFARRAHWRNGDPHGFDTEWDPTGRLRHQSHYDRGIEVEYRDYPPWLGGETDQGVPDGVFEDPHEIHWDEPNPHSALDKVRKRSKYRNGAAHGVWTWYDRDGTVEVQRRFEMDQLMETRSTPPWWEE